MTTSTLTLAEFILQRIAEDEAAARECARAYPPPWEVADRGWRARVYAESMYLSDDGALAVGETDDVNAVVHTPVVTEVEQGDFAPAGWLGDHLAHIARHDPARVLAECEAKQRIVKLEIVAYCDNVPRSGFVSDEIYEAVSGRADTPVLRALALPYADHPEFRAEWAL